MLIATMWELMLLFLLVLLLLLLLLLIVMLVVGGDRGVVLLPPSLLLLVIAMASRLRSDCLRYGSEQDFVARHVSVRQRCAEVLQNCTIEMPMVIPEFSS